MAESSRTVLPLAVISSPLARPYPKSNPHSSPLSRSSCSIPEKTKLRHRRRASRPVWVAGCVEEVCPLPLLLLEGAGSRYVREYEHRTLATVADRRLPLFRPHRATRRRTSPFRHFVVSPRAYSPAWSPRNQRPPRFGVCAAVPVPTPAAAARWLSSPWGDFVPIQPRLDFCFYILHVNPRWLNRCWLRSHWSSSCRRRFWDLGAVARRRAMRRTVAALRRRRRRASGDASPLAPPCAEPFRLGPSYRRAPLLCFVASTRKKTTGEREGTREDEIMTCGPYFISVQ
uniref:Uncharacterized protein n=1 Tax=Oryza barthii TaxID=65489 RepID=A0A0D3H529_9ORYZ